MSVESILNQKGSEVISTTVDVTLSDICVLLAEHKIGAVPVTGSSGELLGIISERDVVKTLGRTGSEALSMHVSEVMTQNVITCQERDSVLDALGQMSQGRFRHMPVVRGNRLVGMISIGDAVKYRIAQVEMEAEDLRSYIAMA
ncbi:MAG: CBS domain-containing protein [Rhodobacteraceae bacterium]|nr:CBS domain-containing protein [Paracoccaceae bacterium]